jgi:hypothetical protein
MVFPKNNLPVQSQPWTRDVEKRVENLESTFRSAEVNNATRDSQALSQIRRLDAAVTDVGIAAADASAAAATALAAANTANTSLNGLVSLGTDGSTYSVHGGNITANTITANEISAGYVYAGTLSANQINSGSLSADFISGGTIDASNINGVTITGTTITGGSINSSGTFTTSSGSNTTALSGGTLTLSGAGGTGGISAASFGVTLSSSNTVFVSAPNGIDSAIGGFGTLSAGDITASGAITRSGLAGGGLTGASITNSGAIVRTSSSQRYKTDIQLLDINLNDLYALQPKTFKRKDEFDELGEEARTYPGFIAEELAGTSLDKFVFYGQDEDGNPRPEGIHYAELTAALLLAIKNLNARIEALEGGV